MIFLMQFFSFPYYQRFFLPFEALKVKSNIALRVLGIYEIKAITYVLHKHDLMTFHGLIWNVLA